MMDIYIFMIGRSMCRMKLRLRKRRRVIEVKYNLIMMSKIILSWSMKMRVLSRNREITLRYRRNAKQTRL